MHANFIKIIEDLRSSYWFIPACMTIAALVLSFVMETLDANFGASWLHDVEWLSSTRTDGARSVLTVIAGSIIGVAGVTFSITIVAVSYASANFGPRLIGNFMRDRGNQVTLGTFIATFVYCLMILRTVRNAAASDSAQTFDAFVPHFSIILALALAISSICVLIYFIHHVPETINVGNIAADIGIKLKKDIDRAFPDTEAHAPRENEDRLSWERERDDLYHKNVQAGCSGYIQALDESRLGEIARNRNFLIRVQYRPGDFAVDSDIILDVWSETPITDDSISQMQECYAIGRQRTAYQNILFLTDELIEIIARALSPGVNDPFTAITCLNWLKLGLASFAVQDKEFSTPPENSPVLLHPLSFENFVSAIFDQCRQYVCQDRNVSLHAITILTEVAALAGPGARQNVLKTHMKKLSDACAECLGEEEGGRDIRERYRQGLQILVDTGEYDAARYTQHWFGGSG